MEVQPQAHPFYAGGSTVDAAHPTVGVLLCHGFTGSPASVRPWGEYLARSGLAVAVPRLPGHGTTWQQLNRTEWPDWYAAAERDLLRLSDRCAAVVVGGLSMGGALALRLAERYGARVSGVVLVNPSLGSANKALLALPVLRRLLPSVAGIGNDIKRPGVSETGYDRLPLHALASLRRLWRQVVADLPAVRQPLLLFRSLDDHVVDPTSARLLRTRVSSRSLEERVLANSYHVATLDNDAPTIFETSLDFVRRVTRTTAGR